MSRKVISIFISLASIIFSISCYTTRFKEVRTVAEWKGKKGKIFWVIKTNGEHIVFANYNPGRIIGAEIVGKAVILSKEIVIARYNIKRIKKDSKGNISEIISKDKKVYYVISGTVRKEKGKIIFFLDTGSYISVSIPISEVKSMQLKRFDPLKTLLSIVGTYAILFAAAVLCLVIAFSGVSVAG